MNNIETQSINPFEQFVPQEIFENEILYHEILLSIKAIINKHQDLELNGNQGHTSIPLDMLPKGCKAYDYKLSHFILWISTPLRADIFYEIAIVICLLRTAILTSIWYTGQKNLINIKPDNTIEIKMTPWTLLVKATKADIDKMNSFSACNICPLLGSKWNEVRKSSNGKILDRIIPQVVNEKSIEVAFEEKIKELGEEENDIVSKMAEAVMALKESELKEAVKTKRKFNFLNWNTLGDLKDLIQKACGWLQYFSPEEFNLQDVDINFPK